MKLKRIPKLHWFRSINNNSLVGRMCPIFSIYKDGKQWILQIQDLQRRGRNRNRLIPIKSPQHGKQMAAKIMKWN